MSYFLEPFKTRTYPIITDDWSIAYFQAEFDDAEFIHVEEEKAIYLYANFISFYPEPTTKYKPENFNWQPPVTAAIIFHYDEYMVNVKEGGEWKKVTNIPGVVETTLCNHLLKAEPSFLNVPLAGAIDFKNSMKSRNILGGTDETAKLSLLNEILAIFSLEKHNPGFTVPAFGKKNSGSGNSKTTSKQSALQIIEERKLFLDSILAETLSTILDKEIEPKTMNLVVGLKVLSKDFPEHYKALIQYLLILMRS